MSPDRMAAAAVTWWLRRVAWMVGRSNRDWLDALLAELDTIPPGCRRLVWALGGLRLSVALAVRSRPRLGWLRHPGRSAALLLGAPLGTVSHRRPGIAGTRQYLIALACACLAGLCVLVLRGLLEDSPYGFNAGRAAPAGLHPDWANPMSLAFDVVVIASAAELLAIGVLTICFLWFPARGGRRPPGPVRTALAASAVPLWVLVAATVFFGVAAHQSAPSLFDQGRAPGLYLTWASWVGLAAVMTIAAAIMTAAAARSGRRSEARPAG